MNKEEKLLDEIRWKVGRIGDCFNINVDEYVEKEYGKAYADILKGKLEDERLIKILNTCRNKEEWNGGISYGKDVILGWVTENMINDKINNLNKFKSELSSMDRDREFIKAEEVRSTPDLLVTREKVQATSGRCAGEKEFRVEVVTDFNSYWKNHNKLHLRTTKLDNLKKHSKNGTVCILALDLKNKKFKNFEITENTKATYIESHKPYNGKPAWELEFDSSQLVDLELLDNKDYFLSLLN